MNVLVTEFTGEWLKAKREELELSQSELGRMARISQEQISKFETNTSTMSLERIRRILAALEQVERERATPAA